MRFLLFYNSATSNNQKKQESLRIHSLKIENLLLFLPDETLKKEMTSGREIVKEEIKHMKNVDNRTVESYDALMRSLGL